MVGDGMNSRLFLSWFVGLAEFFVEWKRLGIGRKGLLDANVTMIPEADGDSTSLGRRLSCFLPVVKIFWASVRFGHIQAWFYSCVPDTLFSASKGVRVWMPGIPPRWTLRKSSVGPPEDMLISS